MKIKLNIVLSTIGGNETAPNHQVNHLGIFEVKVAIYG